MNDSLKNINTWGLAFFVENEARTICEMLQFTFKRSTIPVASLGAVY